MNTHRWWATVCVGLATASLGALPAVADQDVVDEAPDSEREVRVAGVMSATPTLTRPQAEALVDGEPGQLDLASALEPLQGVDGVYLDSKGAATALALTPEAVAAVTSAGGKAVLTNVGETSLNKTHDDIVQASQDRSDGDLTESGVELDTRTVSVGVRDPQGTFAQHIRSTWPAVRIYAASDGTNDAAQTIGGWKMSTSGSYCTTGFNAVTSGGTKILSAGHCTRPLGRKWTVGSYTIGESASSRYGTASADDIGIVNVYQATYTSPAVSNRVGGVITVKGKKTPYNGMVICNYGVTTGRKCGRVENTRATTTRAGGIRLRGVKSSIKTAPGDSGGPVMNGYYGVGIHSGRYYSDGKQFFVSLDRFYAIYGVRLKTG